MASSLGRSGARISELSGSAIADDEKGWAKLCDDDNYWVLNLKLHVPLDRREERSRYIPIHASIIYGKKKKDYRPVTVRNPQDAWVHYSEYHKKSRRRFLVYLCGGPGDENTYTKTPAVNEFAIKNGFQVLHLDYRGTGKYRFDSKDVCGTADRKIDIKDMDSSQLAEHLAKFTQDNIVLDLEAVRIWLSTVLPAHDIKFTLLAQSFGGWIAMTYLSYFPQSLEQILLTAAMPPFTKTPQEVYQSLYKRVINRNEKYYSLYPKDVGTVREVVLELFTRAYKQGNKDTILPDGRRLGYDTLLTLGRLFGGQGQGSFDKVHDFIIQLESDLKAPGTTRPIPANTLKEFAKKDLESFRLHQRPLYGLLHEAIYCHSPGIQPNWAASNVGKQLGGDPSDKTSPCRGSFSWLHVASNPRDPDQNMKTMRKMLDPTSGSSSNTRLFFTGEMIHPFMLDSQKYPNCAKSAEKLAKHTKWEHLYDLEMIRKNPYGVPVRAVVYKGDMYVDWEVSLDMAEQIGGPCEVYLVTPNGEVEIAVQDGERKKKFNFDGDHKQMDGLWEWTHGAVKQAGKTEKVLGLLFNRDMW